jgi:hypothetical protein
VLIPLDAEVEREPTELLVEDCPVESEPIPVDADVERELTPLFVVERPVESEVSLL